MALRPPSGSRTDTVGPFTVQRGMQVGLPHAELAPEQAENLFNLFIDRHERALARPGSVFVSRVGEGAVIGLGEHSFESGIDAPRPVAVVVDPYSEVTNLQDSSNDPATSGQPVGFVPDWSKNGHPILPLPAKRDDRFHFASFLNRLYLAGSTSDHRIRWYDYSLASFKSIEGVKGLAVASFGNRLWVGGNPDSPNLLYPSDPDDPEQFNPNLAFQVGNRNDHILRIVEHDGMLVVLADRSVHWVLAGFIEGGDIQTERITEYAGLAGSLAVDSGSDGWLYWLSRTEGPVRWRRGGGMDTSFAKPIRKLFEAASPGDLKSARVVNDPLHQAVHFLMPTGDSSLPTYMLSWFWHTQGWTHSASTSSLDQIKRLVERQDPVIEAVGPSFYSHVARRFDPLSKREQIYAGGENGIIWRWASVERDRVRSNRVGESGTPFRSLARWGPMEIAPVGHRGMIHEAMVDIEAPAEFSFVCRAERDFDELWQNVAEVSRDIGGGSLNEIVLGDEKEGFLHEGRFHPHNVRIPFWKKGLGKVVRIEFEWDGLLAITGFELERSLAGPHAGQIQTPIDPFGSLLHAGEDPISTDGSDDGEAEDPDGDPLSPHDPPTEEDLAVTAAVRCDWDSDIAATVNVADATDLQTQDEWDFWPNDDPFNPAYCAMTADEEVVFFLSRSRTLQAWDISDPTNASQLWFYDMVSDVPDPNEPLSTAGVSDGGLFYDEANDRLIVHVRKSGGDAATNDNAILVYDVSDRPGGPSFLGGVRFGQGFPVGYGLRVSNDGTRAYAGKFIWDGSAHRAGVYSFSISGAGVPSVLDSLHAAGPSDNVNSFLSVAYNDARGLLALAQWEKDWFRLYDVSDPSNMSLLGLFSSVDDAEFLRPDGMTFNKEGTRLYVKATDVEPVSGKQQPCVYSFDVEAPLAITKVGTTVYDTGAPSGHFQAIEPISVSPDSKTLFYAQPAVNLTAYDVEADALTPLDQDEEGSVVGGNTFVSVAIARGATATKEPFTPGGPDPLPANVGVINLNEGTRGIVAFIDLDAPDAPEVAAWSWDTDLYFWSGDLFNDGDHVLCIGAVAGALVVYTAEETENLRTLKVEASLQDNRLMGHNGVAVDDANDRAWLFNGSGDLVEVDISDPTAPTIVGATAVDFAGFDFAVPEIHDIHDGHLLCRWNRGWHFINLTSQARVGGIFPPEHWQAKTVLKDGTTGYVLSHVGGGYLSLLDLSTPNPTLGLIGGVSVGASRPRAMVKSGDMVYVLNETRTPTVPAIIAIDVSTPATPVVAGTLADADLQFMQDLSVNGTDLYVCTSLVGSQNVVLVDASTPAAMTISKKLSDGKGGTHADSDGTKLYCVGEAWLRVYDMAATPISLLGEHEVRDSSAWGSTGIGVENRSGTIYAFVQNLKTDKSQFDLVALDATTPGSISEVGNLINAIGQHLTVDSQVAVVAWQGTVLVTKDIYVVDLGTPSAMSILAVHDQGPAENGTFFDNVFAVDLDANLLLVGHDRPGGVTLIDLTTPDSPDSLVSSWFDDDLLYSLAVELSDTALISWQRLNASRLYRFDTTSKAAPVSKGFHEIAASSDEIRGSIVANWDGTQVYLSRATKNSDPSAFDVEVWDVSTITSASKLGALSLGFPLSHMRISGTGPKVHGIGIGGVPGVDPGGHFVTIDFTTPSAPTDTGRLSPVTGGGMIGRDLRLW